MKKLLLFAICITMLTDASSQQSTFDLILNGVIVYIKPEELKKIKVVYYTVNNEKFSGKRSVKVTDGKCKFQLSKTKYAKVTTGDLVFAIDT
ncbi:MAG: hypothetical protein ACKVOR_01560, partial [Flavobacteriales bacterium]